MRCVEPAKPVVTSAEIEASRAAVKKRRFLKVVRREPVALEMDEGVGVLRVAARCGEEKAAVRGCLGEQRLDQFQAERGCLRTALEAGPWGQKFPTVAASWRRAWTNVIPFFAFPPAVRRVIYTTNAIESVNARLRKIIKTRGHFPSDEAASKLLWLALRNITTDWGRPAHNWKEAMNQFAILYQDRFTRVQA